MRFVLDTSLAMSWLLQDGKPADAAYARRVLISLQTAQAIVPCLWSLEMANVIAKAEAKGLLAPSRAQAFIAALGELPIETDICAPARALGDVLNIARRFKLSSYDAAYLELAMREGLSIATLDADLGKAAKKAGVARYQPA